MMMSLPPAPITPQSVETLLALVAVVSNADQTKQILAQLADAQIKAAEAKAEADSAQKELAAKRAEHDEAIANGARQARSKTARRSGCAR